MATVISLTETKIKELMAGWESLGLNQTEISSLVLQLQGSVSSYNARIDDVQNTIVPQLQADMAEGMTRVDNLNDSVLPQLQLDLEQAQLALQNLETVHIPSIQDSLQNQILNAIERPKVYVQDEPPEDPDLEERDLVVGDVWFDSNDDNKQHIWNGVEWSTFAVDIPDLSLTVNKFKTNTHMIY